VYSKARDTYEIMRAEDVGWSANKIVLGKLSGRNAFKQRLQDLGAQLDSETEINAAFARFKELADRKSEIFDEDILALLSEESVSHGSEQFGFVSLSQRSETGERPHASIVFTVAGREVTRQRQMATVPVDASLKAIEAHVQSGAEMVLYSVNAISGSTESQGEVTGAAAKQRACGQWRWRGPRHRGGLGKGLPERAEQIANPVGTGSGAGLAEVKLARAL